MNPHPENPTFWRALSESERRIGNDRLAAEYTLMALEGERLCKLFTGTDEGPAGCREVAS